MPKPGFYFLVHKKKFLMGFTVQILTYTNQAKTLRLQIKKKLTNTWLG